MQAMPSKASTASATSAPSAQPERGPDARIAFQGAPGAYSDLACRDAFPQLEPLPCPDFEDALRAVQEKSARCAMIPIENSTAGRVADIHHLLPESGLAIIGEYFLPVRHCLWGIPGARLEKAKRVLSHVQALSQCRQQLMQLGLTPTVFSDTAAAAKEVASAGIAENLAIASPLAGEIYGLELLNEALNDRRDNTTRFVVLAREPLDGKSWEGDSLTTLVFRTRSEPGALVKVLISFATEQLNLTKLESDVLDSHFASAQFYIDVEGHVEDPAMKRALRDLAHASDSFRLLGSYPAASSKRQLAP